MSEQAISREDLETTFSANELTSAQNSLHRFLEANKGIASAEYAWRLTLEMGQRLEIPDIRLAFASSFTIEPIVPFLGTALFRKGFLLNSWTVSYSRWYAALAEESDLDEFEPGTVFVLLHAEDVLPLLSSQHLAKASQLDDEQETFLAGLASAASAFRERSSANLVFNTLTFMNRGVERYFDWNVDVQRQQRLDGINSRISEITKATPSSHVFDYSGLVADFGRDRWYDKRGDALHRTAVSPIALPALASDIANFIVASYRPRKKALVVDLDNTIWGGIVGEAGPLGIAIGGDYPGNAFQSFQAAISNLRATGVVLAIASKNNHQDASDVFALRCDDMILEKGDFAVEQIHWKDKPLSLRTIADKLNIGTDALVFVDDSPMECELVRRFLPEVMTLNVTGSPANFAEMVLTSGAFDVVTLTDEDHHRAEFYSSEAARGDLEKNLNNKQDFLASLDIELTLASPNEQELERVVQLINKTNQFNMTTRRYTMADILGIAASNEHEIYIGKLKDKFGSYGLVGVCILEQRDADCVIDTFLLSCRALGRGAEDAMLAYLEYRARGRGALRLIGQYVPTKKNQIGKNFYGSHGLSNDNGLFVRDLVNTEPISYPTFLIVSVSE